MAIMSKSACLRYGVIDWGIALRLNMGAYYVIILVVNASDFPCRLWDQIGLQARSFFTMPKAMKAMKAIKAAKRAAAPAPAKKAMKDMN